MMSDQEMIDRVAEAIYNDTKSNYKEFEPYKELYPRTRSIYIAHAKAAIKAMREPTEKMIDKGDKAIAAGIYTEGVWNKMIDAVLND